MNGYDSYTNWSRHHVKERAWEILSDSLWTPVLVAFLMAITEGGIGEKFTDRDDWPDLSGLGEWYEYLYVLAPFIILTALAFFVAWIIFGYAFAVGGRRYFLSLTVGDAHLDEAFWAFNKDRILPIIGTMLLRSIYLFFWTCLFIVPGIIKYYSYRMVPYILADEPTLGANEAIDRSRALMSGQKWDLFVLDLSFIGWYFLGALALGLGVFLVFPYHHLSIAHVYANLRTSQASL